MRRWQALAPEQRQAAAAAVALALCMVLPWYSVASLRGDDKVLTAFGVFSWVEAAVLLVAAAVLYLLWARSEGRAFHLPGGDGWAITAGGLWTEFLLVWRLFDKPDVQDAAVGITWGLFVTMIIAGVLAAAGQRLRAAHRPEPPNPAAEDPTWEMPDRRRADDRPRRPGDATAITEVLRTGRPQWEGEPPEPPGRGTPPLWPDAGPAGPPAAPADAEQKPDGPEPPGAEQPRLF